MYQQRFGNPLTPRVKLLLIINVIVFLIQMAAGLFNLGGYFDLFFGFNFYGFFGHLWLWQVFTYMFLHSRASIFHILFNSLALWMFGGELEQFWGSKRFFSYYLLSGLGAGIFIAIVNFVSTSMYGVNPMVSTVGASGAIFALLVAYGMIWPNREVYIWGIFPIKVKYLVILFGCISFFGTFNNLSGGGGISHIGHLGGLISGIILFMRYQKKGVSKSPKKSGGIVSGFFKKRRIEKKREEIEKRKKAKEIIDKMLDKIALSGVNALTPEERKELEWARRHYYPQDDDVIH